MEPPTRSRPRRFWVAILLSTLILGGIGKLLATAINVSVQVGHGHMVAIGVGGALLAILVAIGAAGIVATQRRARAATDRLATGLSTANTVLESALAEASALRLTIDALSIVSVTDRSGRILDANEQFCAISGYSREELIGQNHRLLNSGHHPRSFWVEMWRTVLAGSAWQGEVCNRAKDGSLYWVHSSIAPCRDHDGVIRRLLSVRTDITARKNAMERLLLSEAQLQQAQLVARTGSWSQDPSNGQCEWSQAMATILEFEPAGSPITTLLPVVHHEDRAAVERLLQQSSAGTTPAPQTHRLQMPDGRVKHVLVRCGRHSITANAQHRTIGIVQDITEQRELELELMRARQMAEAANQAKSDFLANMSHEIRTPLTAILGYVDLLEEVAPTDAGASERAKMITAIHAAGDHLSTVIDDILDLSKIEAGRLSIEPLRVDLPTLLAEVETLLRPRAKAKGLGLTISTATSIPQWIRTDPTRVRQILLNLLGNAVKFTEQGTVALRVGAQRHADAATISFDVTDTGIGMSEAQVAQLFRPFMQANMTTTRRFGGTGLGLAISARLATALGGRVELVHSAPGTGSHFRFTFDTTSDASSGWVDRITRTPTAQPLAPLPQLQGRVLLAEDGPDNQRLISHILRKAGATVEVAGNGREAWDTLTRVEIEGPAFDLLVTDLQMPELDGLALIRMVRESGRTVPILVVSAHAMPEEHQRCLAAGCDAFAAKPIQRASLLNACARLLGSGAQRRSPVG